MPLTRSRRERRFGTIAFQCPDCRSALKRAATAFECMGCSATYPIEEGIPVFSKAAPYYGEIGREPMRMLIEQAKRDGYQEALRAYLKNAFVYAYATDETRARWIDLLPVDHNLSVLDVGCGWGTISIPIARQAGLVVALDATYERAKFVEVRADQSETPNVVPVAASALRLPLAPAQFDMVIFNGVLEWLGASDSSLTPAECQMRALREAHRVLRPGGLVYVGIENRYSLRYMLGKLDDHSLLRFTSLMPRWLADAYCRWRTGERYYTHTHSLGTYRTMLAEAGFGETRPYLPWPTYRHPEVVAPLRKIEILALLGELSREARFGPRWLYLNLLRLVTAVEGAGRACHAFCFVARKQ